jgi:predicted nucleic acid-binding protein
VIELWDTSALILAARDAAAASALAEALAADDVAICEPVLLEYLNGARNLAAYDRFRQALGATRMLEATAEDWARALQVHRLLAATGPGHQRSVRLVDLVIAATAERHAAPIVHVDHDYDRIAAITGQAVRWIG